MNRASRSQTPRLRRHQGREAQYTTALLRNPHLIRRDLFGRQFDGVGIFQQHGAIGLVHERGPALQRLQRVALIRPRWTDDHLSRTEPA